MNSARCTKNSRAERTQSVGVLLAFVLWLTAGCVATVPEGSSALKSQALSFTPPQNRAGVYVVRPLPQAWTQLIEVSLDFRPFGSIAPETYLFTTVPTGTHVISL